MSVFPFSAVLLTLALFSAAPGWADEPADQPVATGTVAAKIDDYLTRLQTLGFSGVVLVAQNDEILLRKGYGSRDRENRLPFTTGTVSDLGSITKQFTAAAILKLEMRGALRTDDPISRFFNNVPADKSAITIQHLLTHTAGLPDGFGDDWDLHATREWLAEQALACKLQSKPGERYSYSNAGYSLLAMIVEKASGAPYETFLVEELLKPAGMTRTGYLAPKFDPREVAVGYHQGRRWGTTLQRPLLADGPCWNLRGNGGIHSTADDMHRWMRALHGPTMLSEAARKKMFTPYANNYGYGWSIFTTARKTRCIQHSGGNDVLYADLKYFPEERVLVFMMTNTAERPAEQITPHIAQIVFGEPYPLPPKVAPFKLDASAANYAGFYRTAAGGKFEVKCAGDQWRVAALGQDAVDLLLAPADDERRRYRRLNEKTEACLRALAAGEFGPLREAIGPDAPPRPFEKHWQSVLAESGAFRDVEILGTAPAWFQTTNQTATWLRLTFERGADIARFHWNEQDRFAGLGGQAYSAPLELEAFPVQAGEFAVFHFHLPLPEARFVFRDGSGGAPQTLLIRGRGAEVTATRER